MKRFLFPVILLLLTLDLSLSACTYCDPQFKRRQTLREDARQAKFVVYATASNPRINPDMSGQTDLKIEGIVKDDPFLKNRPALTIGRYIPIDPKGGSRFLLFCDLFNQKPDIYRGLPVKDNTVVEYLQTALKLDDTQREKSLLFYFKHLDSEHAVISADAFLEFAKASDAEIGAIAKSLNPEKIRKLLHDPKTPTERLSLYAFLLGSCGNKKDTELLQVLIQKNDERTLASMGGLLGGIIELKPQEGWATTQQILADPKQHPSNRLSALNTLRFYQTWKPKETRPQVLACMKPVIEDGELADLVVEDLRRWQWWDHTETVLKQFEKPSHSAPIVKRALIRYALCCPDPKAIEFIRLRKIDEPTLVREVQEGLEFEKPTPSKQ